MQNLKTILIWNVIIIGLVSITASIYRKHIYAEAVYAVCNRAHTADNPDEETCGYLQDKYNVEFLCRNNYKGAANNCWVEEK